MNPPPPGRGRFVRGRARGGGAHRPYFYFRRNGRVIPARGGPGDGEQGAAPSVSAAGGLPARGSRGRGRIGGANAAIDLDSSFLRPENYVAPADGPQAMSYAVETDVQCPGWQLYFTKGAYDRDSECAARIKAMEAHYAEHVGHYDVMTIQRTGWFTLTASVVHSDGALNSAWPTLANDLLVRPLNTLAICGLAMHSLATLVVFEAFVSGEASTPTYYVPPLTYPGKVYVRPVGFQEANIMAAIRSAELDSLFTVRGAVAAIGDVQAAASWITFRCPRCNHEQVLKQIGLHPSHPYSCKRAGCLAKQGFVEMRSSPHTRITPLQIVRLAETHIQAAFVDVDEEPNYIDVELRYDLVDQLPPGQEVVVMGVLRMRPLVEEGAQQAAGAFPSRPAKAATFNVFLKAVTALEAAEVPLVFTERDCEAIAQINNEPDSFKLLVHSLAPELHGQEMAKAGVLLSLLGGAGSHLHNEAEISVLLVGDPGIGKSHLLQMCAAVAQRSSLLGGKRRSGGPNSTLLADVRDRGDFTINSGALLNAIGGHCCIDDLDRLASQQEHLLHVLQTKQSTLSYPHLFATLPTPTSVIASVNPTRGHYDQSRLLLENVRLHPSLLPQFSLIFLLQDKPNKEADVLLTEHIRALHAGSKKSANIAARYELQPKADTSMRLLDNAMDITDEPYNLEHRLRLKLIDGFQEEELDLLPPILIKKFLAYARQKVKPLLDAGASEALREFYMRWRDQNGDEKCSAVGIGQLESLIRLTQARARLDLAAEATALHVRDVISLVEHSQSDIALGDYVDLNPAMALASTSTKSGSTKKFVQLLQARSNAVGRRLFDFDELKEVARRVGITSGVTALVESINYQGVLLKRGHDMYEVMPD